MDYKKEKIIFQVENKDLYVTEIFRSSSSYSTTAKPQVRNSHIIHFITKGTVKAPNFTAHAGEGILLPKNLLYTFSFKGEFDHFWIGFNGDYADELLNMFGFLKNKQTVFKITDINKINNFLTSQMSSLNETKSASEALSTLLYCMPYISQYQNKVPIAYVEKAKKFIENNYQYNISIQEVANNVNISEKHLCKLFNKTMGISPQKYLIKMRMNTAKNLLTNTEMLIGEVADNVGFSSQFAFSTAYKKHYGISPTEQKNINKKVSEIK